MDTGRWFYHDGKNPIGPFLLERVMELAAAGTITPDTLVQREGSEEWISFARVLQVEPSTPTPPPLPIDANASERMGVFQAAFLMSPMDEAGISRKPQWSAMPAKPGRRLAARFLDMVIYTAVGGALLGYALYSFAPISAKALLSYLSRNHGEFFYYISAVFLAAILGSVVVGSTGSSIGKAIFGVRVLNRNREPIGILNGFAREFRIWWKGLALGIPLFALIAVGIECSNLLRKGATSWDRRGGYLVLYRPNGPFQYSVYAIIIILLVIFTFRDLWHLL